MDCNREEALKAIQTAERKFRKKDIKAARKFALKAQTLLPSLEGINQMVATLDVHLAAENKINGETDWYAILSVSASADEETLKKHYKKLALLLHPDKNKSIGAKGAFKLLSEAWSVLSDKNRKSAYDQSRNINGFQNITSDTPIDQPVHASSNGFCSFSKSKSGKRARKCNSGFAPQSHPVTLNTFWTSCSHCRMQYEYLRIYLNHNLLCPNCHQAFLAIETGVPGNAANSSTSWSAKQQQQTLNHNYTINNGYSSSFCNSTSPGTVHTEFQHGGNFDSYNHQSSWSSFTGSTGYNRTTEPNSKAANLVPKKFEKMRRKHEATQAAAQREGSFWTDDHVCKSSVDGSQNYDVGHSFNVYETGQHISKVGRPAKRRSNGVDSCTYPGKDETQITFTNMEKTGKPELQKANGGFEGIPRNRMTSKQNNFIKEFSQINIRQMLIEKVKATVGKKLGEWNTDQETKLVDGEQLELENEQEEPAINGDLEQDNCLDDSNMDSTQINDVNLDKKVPKPLSIDVPDPDFYDFDKDRLEKTFKGDQVWATYDSEDGMPRLYAMVQKVLSRKPFQIRMSFLNTKSNSELGPMNWVACGYTKTCGDFRVSRYRITDTVNIFSHRVKWEKGFRGVIRIVPKKGDTWALYRNWSPDWNELTPEDVIYKYEMVEILDDYNDENGVSVIPLVKVAGFKAVFHRHMGPMEVRRIPREEMFRFSHQVPSYLLTGEEAPNALKGCLELDPAATPVELLQVITEVKEDVEMETNGQDSGN